MNGKISIDGYISLGGVEINIHGGEPDPKALVNIIMRIHNNMMVKQILEQALEYVDGCIGTEPQELTTLAGGKSDK